MPPRVTLREVADAAGVSTFTASKALNGGRGVSEKSCHKVISVARQLGYVPNLAAQELRGAARNSVAVITAGTDNAYYLDMMNGIQKAAQAADQSVVQMDIAVKGVYSEELERRTVQRLLEARMSGVISTLTLTRESIARLAEWDVPVVFVNSSPPEGMDDLPSITTDNHGASLLVGEHLAGCGYTDWLFLAYPDIWSSRKTRESGLREAARRAGAELQVVEAENSAAAGCAALMAAMAARKDRIPDVLIAGNSPLLLGAMTAMSQLSIKAPEDMAIVSYDDFAWAPFVEPPLTVLDERAEEIGMRAAETLVQIIAEQAQAAKAGKSAAPNYRKELTQQVPVGLIVRRSCGSNGKGASKS